MIKRNMPSGPVDHDTPGLGPRKTLFVMVTVVGCIAILWPKVFYPMMFGGGGGGLPQAAQKSMSNKDYRLGGIDGLRQERPPHLRPDSLHPAMRERGRAIPTTPTVPIVMDTSNQQSVPRQVEGRPGPIPGMRPPMGAGSVHQANQKGNNMGLVMPLYTIGIVAFFVYTIMKLIFKKPINAEPIKPDENFRKEVFESVKKDTKKAGTNLETGASVINGIGSGGLINTLLQSNDHKKELEEAELEFQLRETEQLLEISLLKKKLRETEEAMAQIISHIGSIPRTQDSVIDHNTHTSQPNANGNAVSQATNGHIRSIGTNGKVDNEPPQTEEHEIKKNDTRNVIGEFIMKEQNSDNGPQAKLERKKRDISGERTVKVLGMEMTASCEGGQKWGRPSTPVMTPPPHHHSHRDVDDQPEPQSIFLEGSLPYESQILVADSETISEKICDVSDDDDVADEPAVVLSSKMTLSLISLDPVDDGNDEAGADATEADDVSLLEDEEMEIINGDEDEEKTIA